MQCPKCGAKSRVIDTRYSQRKKKRRRICVNAKCGERFQTLEKVITPEKDLPLVIKCDGRSEAFDEQKLHKSLCLALTKRPFDNDKVEGLEKRIHEQIFKRNPVEISAQEIGQVVMRELRKLDLVAYIRFASVYRNFKDVGAFQDEVERITVTKNKQKDQISSSGQLDFFGVSNVSFRYKD